MENNNPLDVDQQTPSSTAYIFETKENVILQHGGIASRVSFKKAHVMDLDTFIDVELPKLKATRRKSTEDLYVLKDVENNNITMFYDGCVLKYDVDEVEEVTLDSLSKYIATSEMKTFFPGIHYPLVGYVEKPGRKEITVALDPKKIVFKSERFKGGFFQDTITLPPLWFRVSLNGANSILGTGIAVVLQKEIDPLKTQLHNWVLPNVHGSGEVCLGSTRIEVKDLDKSMLTEGVCVQMAMDQIFNSLWNMDLTWDYRYPEIIGNSYLTLPKLEEYESRIKDNAGDKTVCDMLRLLRVLKEPNGWMTLKWPVANFTADSFLRRA